MFNEILTGKATLEPPPPVLDLHRQEPAPVRPVVPVVEPAYDLSLDIKPRKNWLVRGMLMVVLAFGSWLVRQEIRAQQAAAEQHNYLLGPSSMYGWKLNHFSMDMCSCKDLACGRDVARRYTVWSRTPEGTPDAADLDDAAQKSLQSYSDCLGALEAAH